MKKIIIANWKLNPVTVAEAKTLASKIKHDSQHTVVLCPPTIFLSSVVYPNLGAQDVFWMNKGPHTGQTSPLQLKSLGVKYCIVGHIERYERNGSGKSYGLARRKNYADCVCWVWYDHARRRSSGD
jgi:triosephosphate isomerase